MIRSSPPLEELLDRYRGRLARQRYDESVDQLEHALQCAALAQGAGAADDLVAAALLHDVGHLLTADRWAPSGRPEDDLAHESVGARYLRQWFGPSVTAPVALHVAAKRYLCGADPAYVHRLSAGSVHSLGLQGGPMDDDERRRFEQHAGWEAAVQVRGWDDDAKVVGATSPPFDHYVVLLRSLAGT